MSKKGIYSLVVELNEFTERYLHGDIQVAAAALAEAETLMRGRGSKVPSARFGLAVILAKRSDIEDALGNATLAANLVNEAVALFREERLAVKHGLVTVDAVRQFIRDQDASSEVFWRQGRSENHA